MGVQEYIRTDEFYNRAKRIFYSFYKKHYTTYYKYATFNEMFVDGYITFLEVMKDKTSFDFENENDIIFFFKAVSKGISSKRRNNNKLENCNKRFSDFLDKETEESYLDEIFPVSTDSDYLGYNELLEIFKEFLKNYKADENSKKILCLYFSGQTMKEIICNKNINGNYKIVSNIINTFRSSFADYLIKIGILDNPHFVLENLNVKRKREKYKKAIARKQGLLGVESYLNDYFIYKLIRKNKNFDDCAKLLNKPADLIEKVVNHKGGSRMRIFLYEIQKLRVLFPQYSLYDLVDCSKCL